MAFLIPRVVIRPRVYISGKFPEDAAAALWAPPCRRIGLPPLSLLLLLSSHPLLSFSTSFSSKSIFSSLILLPFVLFSSSLFLSPFQDDIWGIQQEHVYKDLFRVFIHITIFTEQIQRFLPASLPFFIHPFIRQIFVELSYAKLYPRRVRLPWGNSPYAWERQAVTSM